MNWEDCGPIDAAIDTDRGVFQRCPHMSSDADRGVARPVIESRKPAGPKPDVPLIAEVDFGAAGTDEADAHHQMADDHGSRQIHRIANRRDVCGY